MKDSNEKLKIIIVVLVSLLLFISIGAVSYLSYELKNLKNIINNMDTSQVYLPINDEQLQVALDPIVQEQVSRQVEKIPTVQGPQGIPGVNGRDGKDGEDGDDGTDGKDGDTAKVEVIVKESPQGVKLYRLPQDTLWSVLKEDQWNQD